MEWFHLLFDNKYNLFRATFNFNLFGAHNYEMRIYIVFSSLHSVLKASTCGTATLLCRRIVLFYTLYHYYCMDDMGILLSNNIPQMELCVRSRSGNISLSYFMLYSLFFCFFCCPFALNCNSFLFHRTLAFH